MEGCSTVILRNSNLALCKPFEIRTDTGELDSQKLRAQQTEDTQTLIDLINASTSQYQDEKSSESRSLLKRCLLIDENFVGKNHLPLTFALDKLASRYAFYFCKPKEAQYLLEKVVLIRKNFFKITHKCVTHSLERLADLYIVNGNYEKAEQCCSHMYMCPSTYLLKIAHTRFHRISIDGPEEPDGFTALDGFTCEAITFNHFLNNDLKPAIDLLYWEASANIGAIKKLHFIEKTLRLSICSSDETSLYCQGMSFGQPRVYFPQSYIRMIQGLFEGETLLLDLGAQSHAVIHEYKKEGEIFTLKIYNSGGGTQVLKTNQNYFIVPRFKIPEDSIENVSAAPAGGSSWKKKYI